MSFLYLVLVLYLNLFCFSQCLFSEKQCFLFWWSVNGTAESLAHFCLHVSSNSRVWDCVSVLSLSVQVFLSRGRVWTLINTRYQPQSHKRPKAPPALPGICDHLSKYCCYSLNIIFTQFFVRITKNHDLCASEMPHGEFRAWMWAWTRTALLLH